MTVSQTALTREWSDSDNLYYQFPIYTPPVREDKFFYEKEKNGKKSAALSVSKAPVLILLDPFCSAGNARLLDSAGRAVGSRWVVNGCDLRKSHHQDVRKIQ